MTKLKYVVGDVREPIGEGRKLICHCCNDCGRFGSGVALAIMQKWPIVREEYINWFKKPNYQVSPFELGKIQFVRVAQDIMVVNLIGQHDIKSINGVPPIRYEAVRGGLERVGAIAERDNCSVHVPYKMGAGLAGGRWENIEKLLLEELAKKNISVTIYDIDNIRNNS